VGYEGPERRYAHRHHVGHISVTFRHPRFLGLRKSDLSPPCQVGDINSRGMRFYTPARLRVSAVIDVVLECPFSSSADRMEVRGRVIWRKYSRRREAWRTGVHFVDMTDEARDRIMKIVDVAAEHDAKYKMDEEFLL